MRTENKRITHEKTNGSKIQSDFPMQVEKSDKAIDTA